METDDTEYVGQSNYSIHESQSAVNNLIIDYYKKFGRKRDLEQFFSLSTAQIDIRDPTSSFWKKMKSLTDSDSGEKKSESSTELCRISIKCSVPESSTSQDNYEKNKCESESPPIISEEAAPEASRNSDNESVKSDVYSHKSVDGTLDISTNKPHSPTSSITSQRKLEWDSLADVGYGNESDRKNSASSLSTIERIALQQQYSINDTKLNSDLGLPTAQSTPLDINDNKLKNKKGYTKKTTKFYNRDTDSVKLNISQNLDNIPQPINVNLTKHISFNVEKNGAVTIENVSKSVSLSPEKVSVETEVTPQVKIDKEIQTTLPTNKQKSSSSSDLKEHHIKKYPVLISLNTLKTKPRRKKIRRTRRRQSKKKITSDKKDIPLTKSTEQLSEAESFEYMPGHIYNQNQMINDQNRNNNACGNKSSLESSTGLTTDSSKTTKYSFKKDLESGIDILKAALEHRFDDSKLKNKLIKEIVQRLIKSKYIDDESSTEFLSGLSFDSKKLDLYDNHHNTSSTSDANNTLNKTKSSKPKKSILRMDKFNANSIASTSQSVPNLPTLSTSDQILESSTMKKIDLSNTDSDISNKHKNLSDIGDDKTSSDVLYKKYLEALKRESYKKHLKDKEIFLRQKLVGSDIAFKIARQADIKAQNNLKDLMNDLIRNNYDDGSGDASKLEGGSNPNAHIEKYDCIRKQRSHSVFTLSSGNSDNYMKQPIARDKIENQGNSSKACYRTEKHYCCCPYHTSNSRVGVTESSVQVDMKDKEIASPSTIGTQNALPEGKKQNEHKCAKCKGQISLNKAQIVSDCATEDIKYVCLCTGDKVSEEVPENILIYKCSRLPNKHLKVGDNIASKMSNTASEPISSNSASPHRKLSTFKSDDCEKKCLVLKDNDSNNQMSKSSQTNLNIQINLRSKSSDQSMESSFSVEKMNSCQSKKLDRNVLKIDPLNGKEVKFIHEATRWIQTEISINPKISDPSLTDISIVNDQNCVKLISEQYKAVSQPSSANNVLTQIHRSNTQLKSGDCSSTSSCVVDEKSFDNYGCSNVKEISTNTIEKFDKEIQSSPVNTINQLPCHMDTQQSNNFTIPIQGTNMTLKVSLGSEISQSLNEMKTCQNNLNNTSPCTSKETETVKSCVVEKYTSLREECSKGVQSNHANIINDIYQQSNSTIGQKPNTTQAIISKNGQENLNSKPCYVNACITDGCKYNTFPKNDQTQRQKPLLRSNTDTGKMDKICHVTFNQKTKKDTGIQPDIPILQKESISLSADDINVQSCSGKLSRTDQENNDRSKITSDTDDQSQIKSCNSETDIDTKVSSSKDPLLDMIQDITKRYSKKDIEKSKRKKCFKEIITFLNYLLDTDDNTDHNTDNDRSKTSSSSTCEDLCRSKKNSADKDINQSVSKKIFVDKGIQLSNKKSKVTKTCTDSSEAPISTDFPSTSSDSATCRILNKIKKECEKYHQKRCKFHSKDKKCEASSSTSVNCDQCKHIHHCACKGHKCKSHKSKSSVEKKKKCVAYNLIIQTSDSVVSEEITCNRRQLQNIIVKVPSKRRVENVPFKEVTKTIEKDLPPSSPRCSSKNYRSRSLPNDSEISSTDEILRKAQVYTVREYLEKNRPDFVQKCSKRQHCLKLINESRPRECDNPRLNMIVVHTPSCLPNRCMEPCDMCYRGVPISNCNPCNDPYIQCVKNEVTRVANERTTKRQLLSLQLDRNRELSALSENELKEIAKKLGHELRRKNVAPKFISEHEMKKHSEKIYKSLPEVVRKKEEIKKENIKKTNLLMANIFKKNLQKKTLQGAVNLSNYSTVIKI